VTTGSAFSACGLARFHDHLADVVARREVPGLAALVARHGENHVEVLGSPALDDPQPLGRDAIFRLTSLTKPLTAAATMAMVDDGVFSVSDPVDHYLPELADRRVLRQLDGPVSDTVPAERPITVEDLLTFRPGFGFLLAPPGTYPIQDAEAEAGVAAFRPGWPPPPLTSDEFVTRLGSLPLVYQPGTKWLYDTSALVLGVLLERASGEQLEVFMRKRLFEPLGMVDSGFSVPPEAQPRLTAAYKPDASGRLDLLDPTSGGWWSEPPAMANAGGMAVSTIDDYWAFVSMLVNGGEFRGERVLSNSSVAAMTRNHLTAGQLETASPFLNNPQWRYEGWGYGMATPGPGAGDRSAPHGVSAGRAAWAPRGSDPASGLTAILLTQRMTTSFGPPPLITGFWRAAYASFEPDAGSRG
jgi:CubicO group peptidase (beta-lactamase class C family)